MRKWIYSMQNVSANISQRNICASRQTFKKKTNCRNSCEFEPTNVSFLFLELDWNRGIWELLEFKRELLLVKKEEEFLCKITEYI